MKNRGCSLVRNFGTYDEEIENYLRKVYLNSLYFYENLYTGSRATGTEDLDLKTIDKSIGYIEDYLYYFFILYPDKFENVFNALKKNVEKVSVFDLSKRNLYGQYVPYSKSIYVNPKLTANNFLTKDQRSRLYLCHELGHAVHMEWIRSLNNIKIDESNNIKSAVKEGFDLLDEATTQNQAESIAYFYAHKKRPQQRFYQGQLYNGEYYKSNFDFYGNLQEPATLFSKTLRGIGSENDDDIALNLLSERALDSSFVEDIFYEYKIDGHTDDLCFIMSYLGIIKKASYATFGCDKTNYIKLSSEAFKEVKKLASCLRDYREPLQR